MKKWILRLICRIFGHKWVAQCIYPARLNKPPVGIGPCMRCGYTPPQNEDD